MAVPILFDEVLFDPDIIGGEGGEVAVQSWPELANTVIRNPKTGVHKTNVNRFDAIEMPIVNMGLLNATQRAYLLNFWRGGYGSGVGFRMRLRHDFTVIDEVFGAGDGVTTIFYLKKTYTRPGVTARQDVRRIVKPVIDTVARLDNLGGDGGSVRLFEPAGSPARVIPSADALALGVPAFTIKVNNVATTAYVINNTTGKITFSVAPPNGHSLKWSGEFDVPAAFTQNTLNGKHDVNSEVQGIHFREILYPELGILI
jgi:hypothetical protein